MWEVILILERQIFRLPLFELIRIILKIRLFQNFGLTLMRWRRMTMTIGKKQFALKENQRDHLRYLVNPGKLLRQFSLQRRNEDFFIFLECQRIGKP